MHKWFPGVKDADKPFFDVGEFLYRHVHSLHHYAKNPTAWSGVAMHPIESSGYYAAMFLPHQVLWLAQRAGLAAAAGVSIHPIVLLYTKMDLTIAALVGHDGIGYPGGGSQCHWRACGRSERGAGGGGYAAYKRRFCYAYVLTRPHTHALAPPLFPTHASLQCTTTTWTATTARITAPLVRGAAHKAWLGSSAPSACLTESLPYSSPPPPPPPSQTGSLAAGLQTRRTLPSCRSAARLAPSRAQPRWPKAPPPSPSLRARATDTTAEFPQAALPSPQDTKLVW